MPTYEYACQSCGRRFEIFQRFADDPLTVCEECGGSLRKVFHPAGIMFKGSGFYATDSRRGSKSKSDAARESKPSETTTKKETAKEAEPAGGSAGGSGESSGSGGSGEPGRSAGGADTSGSSDRSGSGRSSGTKDKSPKEKSA